MLKERCWANKKRQEADLPRWVGQDNLTQAHLGLGFRVPYIYPILDPQALSKLLRWREKVQEVSPNFQNRLRHTTKLASSSWRIKPTVYSLSHSVALITKLGYMQEHIAHGTNVEVGKVFVGFPDRDCVSAKDFRNCVVWAQSVG